MASVDGFGQAGPALRSGGVDVCSARDQSLHDGSVVILRSFVQRCQSIGGLRERKIELQHKKACIVL